jgi:hypothetical protein
MHLTKCADTKGRLRRVGFLLAIWASAIAGADSSHAADGCASLKDLKIDDATITAAEGVPAGFFTAGDSKSYANLPAFCRVTATLSPMHDSSIRVSRRTGGRASLREPGPGVSAAGSSTQPWRRDCVRAMP